MRKQVFFHLICKQFYMEKRGKLRIDSFLKNLKRSFQFELLLKISSIIMRACVKQYAVIYEMSRITKGSNLYVHYGFKRGENNMTKL